MLTGSRCLGKEGQVHEKKVEIPKTTKGGKKSKKQAPEEDQDICVCHACGNRTCVPCDRPDHSPETCAEYQVRTKGRADEEDKSRAMLLKISKACPSCSKPIQKAGGCNHIMCFACHTDFCWECREVFTVTGCGCTQRANALHAAQMAQHHDQLAQLHAQQQAQLAAQHQA